MHYTFDNRSFYTGKSLVKTVNSTTAIPSSEHSKLIAGKWVSFVPGSAPKLQIVLTAIEGGENTNSDFTYTETKEEVVVTFTGSAALPDGVFLFPIKRLDTGRIAFFDATVLNQVLTVSGDFPTAGEWICDQKLLEEKTALGNRYHFAGVKARVGRRAVVA